jgi:hypothetical protein
VLFGPASSVTAAKLAREKSSLGTAPGPSRLVCGHGTHHVVSRFGGVFPIRSLPSDNLVLLITEGDVLHEFPELEVFLDCCPRQSAPGGSNSTSVAVTGEAS